MSTSHYDYIIVGAGSAGCVLAAQLIQRSQAKILLLEAGGNDKDLLIKMPAGVGKISPQKMWPYETEPEPNANNRKMMVPQGKVLGGSSSVNGMIYIRGQRQDFDEWEQEFGCKGWSYRDVLPYFKRSEANESLSDQYHGTEGMLPVSESRFRHPLSMAFVRAGQELDLPYRTDLNGWDQAGVGLYQTTTHEGERASTSRTYLKTVQNHPSLTLLTEALVHRVIIEDGKAIGVAYSVKGGQEVQALASKEVILSAGAIGTPKILMLSGVGPAAHLSEMGIDTIADLPVGKNFHDHLHMSINASTRDPVSLQGANRGLKALKHGIEWLAFRRGVVSSNILEGAAFIDTQGTGRPDVQIHFLPLLDNWDDVPGAPLPDVHGFTLKVGYLQPKARGELLLRSKDPRDNVKIFANYLGHADDVAGCIRAVKVGLEFVQTRALQPLIKELLMPQPGWMESEEALEKFVRHFCKTVYHPVGSCRMGTDPKDSVTDLSLKVHGIEGLRVVDSSVFPQVTSGNTNAPTIMIAERAVDFILNPAASHSPAPQAAAISEEALSYE